MAYVSRSGSVLMRRTWGMLPILLAIVSCTTGPPPASTETAEGAETETTGALAQETAPGPEDPRLIYATDFSEDDASFVHQGAGGFTGIVDGVMHLQAGDEWNRRWLVRPLENGQTVGFRIKMEKPPKEGSPMARVVFYEEEGNSLILRFGTDGTTVQQMRAHEVAREDPVPFEAVPGRWHEIEASAEERVFTAYADGRLLGRIDLEPFVPETGTLAFFCLHGAYFVDDFRLHAREEESQEHDRQRGSEAEVVYEDGFDEDHGMFRFWGAPGSEIRDGTLYVDGLEEESGVDTEIMVSRGQTVRFALKLSGADGPAEMRLLEDDGVGLYLLLKPGSVSHKIHGREETARHGESAPLGVGTWHEVVVEILQSSYAIFVDGMLIGEHAFLPGLPRTSPLGLVAVDQAFFVDDLRVESLPEQREPREPDAGEPPTPAAAPTATVRPEKDLTDSRIAVVGVEADDAVIAGALAGFVTNAFVNYRVGRIVDRDSVEKIIEEHQFQASAITDEDTAVEIGKLLGADSIAIGSLYRVGTTDYLNVKLIEVETGEILASSIATASDEDDYLQMCSDAVEPFAP